MVRMPVLAATLLTLTIAAPPALAEDRPELTIYTYDAFAAEWGPGPQLKAGFEAECGCTVNFTAVDSSIGALRRVQLEGDTTDADIVLGLDTAIAGEARATGLFAAHGLDLSGLDLPIAWTDDVFVPVDYGYFGFVYDKTKLENPPTSLAELAEREDISILIEDPRSATPGLGLVLWVKAAYGDEAGAMWTKLWDRVVTMTPDWSSAYNLFLGGEADMVLSYTTSPAYHTVAEDNPNYTSAPFGEGHYAQIEIAGIVKSSPHQELARAFLDWLVKPAAQAIIPYTNWMYPVVALPEPVPGFADLPVPDKVLLLADDQVDANAGAWIAEALNAQN